MQTSKQRIQFLDGLRGIAIIFVILFHAFSRWPRIVPYGKDYMHIPLFEYGWLGVQLFFMISGFVIFMSLKKSRGFQDFIVRRWVRLFPAMLICSLIIYFTAAFFYERPAGEVVFRDMLPGLTFIEPYWWQIILGSPQGEMEGAFWSLYVEVKLYFVAGILYFAIGGQRMIWAMIALFLVGSGVLFYEQMFVDSGWDHVKVLLNNVSGRPCGWFAAGALYFRYYDEKKPGLLVAAVIVALASALAQGMDEYHEVPYQWGVACAGFIIVFVFTSAILNERVKQLLSNRILLFIGFVSYPLYLLHENMMISLIVKFDQVLPLIPSLLKPVFPVSIIVCVAWLVTKYAELAIRSKLSLLGLKLQANMKRGLPDDI